MEITFQMVWSQKGWTIAMVPTIQKLDDSKGGNLSTQKDTSILNIFLIFWQHNFIFSWVSQSLSLLHVKNSQPRILNRLLKLEKTI